MGRMYQKGERRRDEIIRAALRVIGRGGTGALTHRAVADEAGVPLSATTYYFDSKEQLLEEALAAAAREETERLERLVLDLEPRSLDAAQAAAVAARIVADVREDPAKHVALFELGLESTRTEALRGELVRWQAALLRLAALGVQAVGSDAPEQDAHIVVSVLAGLMLEQLAQPPGTDFDAEVMRPALERLFSRLAAAPALTP